MSVCLDAFAILTWLQDEPGADLVDEFLQRAAGEKDFRCFVSLVNLGEVYYRLYRALGRGEADTFWRDALQKSPFSPVEVTRRRVLEAARIKARYLIALADAFAVQLAQETQSPLVTGDPEIRMLEEEGVIPVIWLKRPGRGEQLP